MAHSRVLRRVRGVVQRFQGLQRDQERIKEVDALGALNGH